MSEIIKTEYRLQNNGAEYDLGQGFKTRAYLITLTKEEALARFDAHKSVYFIYKNNRIYHDNCRKVVKNRQYLIDQYDVYHEQCGCLASKTMLSDTECQVLNDLAAQAKMDSWFSIQTYDKSYKIFDLETNRIKTLRDGLITFIGGLTYLQNYTWSTNGLRTICYLLDRFDLIHRVRYSKMENADEYMKRVFDKHFVCASCWNALELDEMIEDPHGNGGLDDFQCPYCLSIGKIGYLNGMFCSNDTVPNKLKLREYNLIKHLIKQSSIDHLIRLNILKDCCCDTVLCEFIDCETGMHFQTLRALKLLYDCSKTEMTELGKTDQETIIQLFDRYGILDETINPVPSEPQKPNPDKDQILKNLIEVLSMQCDRLNIFRIRLEEAGIGKDLLEKMGFNIVLSIQSTEGQERIFFGSMEAAQDELKRRYMQARKDPACDRGFLSDTHTYGYVVRDQDRFNSETLFEIDQIFGN